MDTNTGPQAAIGVMLTETVPVSTTYTGSGWTCVPSNNAGSVCTLSVGTLALNATGAAAYVVTVSPVISGSAQITNTARIGSPIPDPVPGDNTATDTTPILGYRLFLPIIVR